MLRFQKAVIIIILISAIILLYALYNSAEQFQTMTEARSNCQIQLEMTCSASGHVPVNWDREFRVSGGNKTNCAELLDIHACPE